MKTLLLYFLTMAVQLVSYTHSDASNPKVFCRFIGDSVGYSYVFNVSDVLNELKGCDVIYYASYYFDRKPVFSTGNENAIKALVDNSITVYMAIRYGDDYRQWSELLYPMENETVFHERMDPLVQFLIKNKISGVVIDGLAIYQPDSSATAQSVADFAKTLKEKITDLKICLRIGGYQYEHFSNNSVFNYELTNRYIDHYSIDLTVSNYCNNKTKHSTVNPIKSFDSSLLTLDDQSKAVMESAMDKSKVIAELQVITVKLENLDFPPYGSYSELCLFKTRDDILKWCSDYTGTLYKQGKFATQYYKGIMLSAIEGDDAYNHCNCGRFIVSKAIMSGWNSEAEPTCTKLDELMKIK